MDSEEYGANNNERWNLDEGEENLIQDLAKDIDCQESIATLEEQRNTLLVALETKTIELDQVKGRHESIQKRLRARREKLRAMEGENENFAAAYETLYLTVTDLNFKVSVLDRCIELKRLPMQERLRECTALLRSATSIRQRHRKLLALRDEVKKQKEDLDMLEKALIRRREKFSSIYKNFIHIAECLQRDLIFKQKQLETVVVVHPQSRTAARERAKRVWIYAGMLLVMSIPTLRRVFS